MEKFWIWRPAEVEKDWAAEENLKTDHTEEASSALPVLLLLVITHIVP